MIKDDRYVLEESTQTILAGQVLAYVTCCCWIYVGTLADELKSLAGAMMSSWRKSGKAAWNSMSIRNRLLIIMTHYGYLWCWYDFCMYGIGLNMLWKCAQAHVQNSVGLKWGIKVMRAGWGQPNYQNRLIGWSCHICFEGGATRLAKKNISSICSYLLLTSRWGWVSS